MPTCWPCVWKNPLAVMSANRMSSGTAPKAIQTSARPILIENRLYMTANNGVCTCVNAETGDEVWKYRLAGNFTASPITANGLIYFCNEEGATTVMRASDQPEVVSINHLAEGMRASPGAADGTLFLRTFNHLYAIHVFDETE